MHSETWNLCGCAELLSCCHPIATGNVGEMRKEQRKLAAPPDLGRRSVPSELVDEDGNVVQSCLKNTRTDEDGRLRKSETPVDSISASS